MKVFTSADLYGHIDGGAEAFLEIGFEQLTVQKYKDGANETHRRDLPHDATPTAARGIYLARCGKETPDPSLKERHTAGRQQILLQRDRYYLLVNNTAGGAANAPMLPKAAQAVASKMPADGAGPGARPAAAGRARAGLGAPLPRAGRPAGDLHPRRRRHPAAGRHADGGRRRLHGRRAGAHTLIVADYPTPAAATAALANVKAHLDSYLKPKSATAAKLVFEDYEKKFGVITVTGKRLEARIHLTKPPA